MRTQAEYSIGKCLHVGRRSQVHAAERRSDRREVALKSYAGTEKVAGAERELEALRAVTGTGIVGAIELIRESAQAATLVLERAPGIPLEEWITSRGPLPASTFTNVALQIADALTRVHGAHLIHLNVTPQSVMVDPRTLQTCLIGFGRSRTLGSISEPERSDTRRELLAGDLLYSSPERTGRMDRGVDSRSDLYSLGATLYFALTGHPPFPGDDPLGLIHAHMARCAPPPAELRPDLPATLSRIVMRLLHKSPEERYQRAAALQKDLLHCQHELERTGTIQDDFPLGSADAPYRPLFSKRLHGRRHEIEQLLDGYRTAAAGQSVVLLLQGAPGIGKSALIHELRPGLARDSGHLAAGRFDLYRREQPYLGIAESLRGLAQQLLTESDAQLQSWRSALRDALGTSAGAIVELAPELGLVLGEVPPPSRLGPRETRLRLGVALRRLVHVLATPEHPLVLVLDDLQWADAGSREMLADVILDPEARALLLVCAFRDNEVDERHPLHQLWEMLRARGVTLRSLALAPLPEQACVEMLAEALGRTPEETLPLAQCVARKTGNAPLLIQQFVQHMHDERLIRFRPEVGWTWNDAELETANIPESAVELLTAKISRLPHAVAEVLELASCVGNVFDLDLLTELSDRPRKHAEPALFTLCEEGLITPAPQGFRFVHDRIREAAQALLSREERARLHGRAARLLLDRTPAAALDQRIFEIADHLNEASSAGLEVIERARALEINARACRRALGAGAGSTAWHYFSTAERQLDPQLWTSHAALCFELFVLGADAAHQCEDFAQVSRCLLRLQGQPLLPMQTIQVLARQIRTSSVTQPRPATVDLTLRLLRRFAIRWSRTPSMLRTWSEVLRTDWGLRSALDETGFQPCPGHHIERIGPVLLISAAGQSLSMTSHRLVLLAAASVLRTYLRYGFIVSPSFALAAYAAYRLRFSGQRGVALRYVQAARAWNERLPDPTYVQRSEMVALAYVDAWILPRQRILEPLRRVSEIAAEAGDFEYACLAEAIRGAMMPIAGCPLPEFEQTLGRLAWTQWSYAMSVAHSTASRVYSVLRTDASLPQVVRDVMSAHEVTQDLYLYMSLHILYVRLIMGDYEQAFEEAERVREPMFRVQIGTHIADYVFLRGWAAAGVLRGSAGGHRRSARRALRDSMRALRRWAHPGSDFVHMHQLLNAESMRLHGKPTPALAAYTNAAVTAREHGHRHQAAMAHERRAELLRELGRDAEARASLRQAVELYEEWGAPVKVTALAAHLEADRESSRAQRGKSERGAR